MTIIIATGLIIGAIEGNTIWPITVLTLWWLTPPEIKYWLRQKIARWLPLPYSNNNPPFHLETMETVETMETALEFLMVPISASVKKAIATPT